MKTFSEVAPYNRYLHLAEPPHPLMDSRVCKEAIPSFPLASKEIQVNLYKIALKKNFTGDIRYGHRQYTTQNGLLLFSAPGQVVSWDTLTFWDGYAFVFHPDLVKTHPVAHQVSQYKYFSYDVHDALFMTPEEEETITWLFTKIHLELTSRRGAASQDVILSLLAVVLTYAERYYERQFQERGTQAESVAARVRTLLQLHYQDLSRPAARVPSVAALAEALHLSADYLTDLVRAETGRSTISLIHDYVLEQAEILLAQTDMNVSEVAYRLGFDNASYFSKLFRKVKGVSPGAAREKYQHFRAS